MGILMLRSLGKTVDADVLWTDLTYLRCTVCDIYTLYLGCKSRRTLLLFRLQKSAIRGVCSFPKRKSCRDSLRTFRFYLSHPFTSWKPFLSFAKRSILIYFSTIHNYSLRNTSDLSILRRSTSSFQKHFRYNAIKLLNSLPSHRLKPRLRGH